jgi:FKBP-type peptidyl-prolyl cis-trans isomerase
MILFRQLFAASVVMLLTTVPVLAETGADFLAQNAKKQGITVTDSGLQYEVIQSGEGLSPSRTDRVTVHYRGTLVDGREFDSSYKRGKPATFPLNRVITGWTEGLQLMKEGDKWRLFIPSNLGYGSRGAGDLIGPNETLIFEVELLKRQ